MSAKNQVYQLLSMAGIEVNGPHPYDIQVYNDNFYARVLAGGSLALGESYMDGWWDCKSPDQFFYRILKANLEEKTDKTLSVLFSILKSGLINRQRKSKAFEIGEWHYDTGNHFFEQMLGKNMNYSCGYWKNASSLEQAQMDKMMLICKKLVLRPGMKLLDIGCGWGSLAKFAAEKFKVKVTGITVSKEQADYAKKINKSLDVDIRLQDYRDIEEKFDRVLSVGMIEHVGYKNYVHFFRKVASCLKNDGIFLLQTIGSNKSLKQTNPWTDKYIFPNGMLPSAKQITKAYEGLFRLEDWHSFGTYYDKTLMAWYENLNKNWDKLKSEYNDRFRRMWNYFLLSSSGAFRAHKDQLWQIVFTKTDAQLTYESIR